MHRGHRHTWRDRVAPLVTCDPGDFRLYLDISKEFLHQTGEIPLSGAGLSEDLKFELSILATVQGFYQKLMWASLGGDVPIPAGLDQDSLRHCERDLPATLSRMYRWLHLLDMAITPAMLRQALTPETDSEVAEALLRYFVRRREPSYINRDKTDLIATFLYRHPRVQGQWEQRGYGLDGALPLSPFEIALIEILADTDVPSLPEEHVQLLRRFDPLQQEVESFPDFNSLIDSGIIQRVRELKQSLDSSFYHPGVLATIAPYNAAFGKKFDDLFRLAASEIQNFAVALEEQGGSILGNVDGMDVTVEHVAAMNQSELLKSDYGTALGKFERVSKLKKALDRRPPMRRGTPRAAAAAASGSSNRAPEAAPSSPRTFAETIAPPPVTSQQLSMEQSKLRRIEESIRIFVRVADPNFRQVVPMRFFNLTLTPAEVAAYCADYLEEKSLRADIARILLRIVAVIARMGTEVEELKRSQNSASVWKLHADALLVLLEIARTLAEEAGTTVGLATERGEMESQAEAIKASLQKLGERSEVVVKTLAQGGLEGH